MIKLKLPKFKRPVIDTRSTAEIVQEIHETFYTEVDRLLEDANIKLESGVTSRESELVDKSNRLADLGFHNTKECDSAKGIKERSRETEKINQNKDLIKEAIIYFRQKYPLYKFITEDSVRKICEKYGLVYGSASKYIGTVPEKNLQEMERFKIKDEDKSYIKQTIYRSMYSLHDTEEIISQAQFVESKSYHYFDHTINYYESLLEIAAPVKDFNMDKSELKGFKIVDKKIPDPVVLQPVMFKNEKFYLIVTAWGDEAEDELVMNEIKN